METEMVKVVQANRTKHKRLVDGDLLLPEQQLGGPGHEAVFGAVQDRAQDDVDHLVDEQRRDADAAGRQETLQVAVLEVPALHQAVCARIEAWLGGLPDWTVLGLTESPITGPQGNKEFLIAARRRT